jgi:hypothetical protein
MMWISMMEEEEEAELKQPRALSLFYLGTHAFRPVASCSYRNAE